MQALMHRTDHDGLMAVRAFLQHAVQMILLPQRLKQRHAAGKTDFAMPQSPPWALSSRSVSSA